MSTSSPAWALLLVSLAIELTLVVALALLIQRALKSAAARRLLWQNTLAGLVLVTLTEASGVGRTSWEWWTAASNRVVPAPSIAAPALVPVSSIVEPVEAVAVVPVTIPRTPVVMLEQETGRWWPGLLWLGGVVLFVTRVLVARALFTIFQRRRRTDPPDSALVEFVQKLARRMGLGRRVLVTYTPGLTGPIAFGFWRPRIGLPVDFHQRFSRTQQEAMLAHELAHLAAGDPWWHLLADLVAALLWWHPLAWWARRQLRAACESAADEASLLVENGPHALAECLVSLGGRMARTHSLAGLGIEGDRYQSGLGRRVKRLLELEGQSRYSWQRWYQKLAAGLCPLPVVFLVLTGTAWLHPREARSETVGQSFDRSILGLAWSSLLQVNLEKSGPRSAANPAADTPGAMESDKIDWQPWSPSAVEKARAEGRPVLVYFTADWSVTAKLNERTSLEVPAVREKLRALGAVVLRADCTKSSEAATTELRNYDNAPVPLTLVFPSDQNEPPRRLPALLTPELLLQALDGSGQVPSRPTVFTKPADTRKNDVSALLLQSKTLLESGKLAEAEAKLKEVLTLDPDNKAVAHYLAMVEARRGKTNLIEIEVESADPAEAAVVANKIAEAYKESRLKTGTAPTTIAPFLGDLPPGLLSRTNGSHPQIAALGQGTLGAPAAPGTTEIPGAPGGPGTSALHTRWFKVDMNTLAANLREMRGKNVASKPARQAAPAPLLEDLQYLLTATGVDLSAPKSIFFNEQLGQLLVRGTLADLDAVEEMIQGLNTSPPQVVIEVKFCEITEDDGRKLGLQWLLGNSAAAKNSSNSEVGLPSSPESDSRKDRMAFGLRDAAGPGNPTNVTLTGILTEPQMAVVLRALEQRRGVDLLTAPRVTTLSGRQAQIKTVEVRYIVTDLDFNTNATPVAGVGADTLGIQPVTKPFELGPVIDLVPYVGADGFTIQLTVIATIKEFLGYDNKERFVATLHNPKTDTQSSPTPLPSFRLRQVVTSAVVWDGQTLVLSGGSMTFDGGGDKIASEGSGQKGASRLLRANAASRQKKSLLVFVTPTIIDPAGNRVHTPNDFPARKTSVPPQKATRGQ